MHLNYKKIHFVGSASGMAAGKHGCWQGPLALKNSADFCNQLQQHHIDFQWNTILKPEASTDEQLLATVAQHCKKLAMTVADLVAHQHFFTVFGGDHSCAIGTWSGVASAIKKQGDMGLIWVDAHIDGHTPETSPSGNIHGMPTACLLGYGYPELTHILGDFPKIKPEHLCLIGVRSFESGEVELLKRLKVKVYLMEEVQQRGLKVIMQEALNLVKKGTYAYGVSVDIDSLDPAEAPGTGCREPGGLTAQELLPALNLIAGDKQLIGIEIVEFDPSRDHNQMTEKLVAQLLLSLVDKH
jgi:arginase